MQSNEEFNSFNAAIADGGQGALLLVIEGHGRIVLIISPIGALIQINAHKIPHDIFMENIDSGWVVGQTGSFGGGELCTQMTKCNVSAKELIAVANSYCHLFGKSYANIKIKDVTSSTVILWQASGIKPSG